MQPSDRNKKTLAVEFNEDRLRAWKEKRAKIAAASRQERERQAEAERSDRTKLLETQKQERLKEAAEQRAAEEAERKAERMQAARIRLAGRADVDAARQRLEAFRKKSARRLAARLFAFVVVPTLACAAYVFWVATPMFEATSQISIKASTATVQPNGGLGALLAVPQGHNDAAQLRAFMLSPVVMAELDRTDGFFSHLGAPEVDPLSRLTPIPALQITKLDQYHRGVDVAINSQEGIITLKTRGRDAATAEKFSTTILDLAQAYVATNTDNRLQIITPPTVLEQATYPRRIPAVIVAFMSFLAIFSMVSIFGATLRRHAGN